MAHCTNCVWLKSKLKLSNVGGSLNQNGMASSGYRSAFCLMAVIAIHNTGNASTTTKAPTPRYVNIDSNFRRRPSESRKFAPARREVRSTVAIPTVLHLPSFQNAQQPERQDHYH